ncbi:DUF805 domain-containing protein [Subtercola boreus]|uniref:DUF805 domain-containing protein n=1 Tax=Subtercola boreus TaxID=120213 RepID=A0A3E0WD17_9MICO|nr:DUF805 domain-containing protein [Subtercola boreus]RFA22528.1 hypothetical protein B7R24_02575 [Subtercola boreus]RFA22884.1 hypothetical protein B7R23_02570 [Subtercola boreus]RFA28636.1 hypothetical protein B7R25_02585 [Subtercola boreus]
MTMPPPPPLPSNQASTNPGGPVPLWAPYYNAPIGVAVRRFFTKYATFSGRASRAEFWWWYLVSVVISIVLNIIYSAAGGNRMNADGSMQSMSGGAIVVSIVILIVGLALLIPSLALAVRRLHDTDHSGWWIFIGLIPLVGAIILLVFYLTGPKPAGARFDQPTS